MSETLKANPNGTQAFDLRLRVFSKEHFHCPVCNAPLNIAALFHPAPVLAASHRPEPRADAGKWKLDVFAGEFCAKYSTTTADLRSKTRFRDVVRVRRLFCCAASEAGFASAGIARWLGVHHTSVLYLLGGKSARRPR